MATTKSKAAEKAEGTTSDLSALDSRVATCESKLAEAESTCNELAAAVEAMAASISKMAARGDLPAGIGERLGQLEGQVGELVRHMPRSRRRMTVADVKSRIADDHTAKFEVIEAYQRGGANFTIGQIVSAQLHGDLSSHVATDLALTAASAE